MPREAVDDKLACFEALCAKLCLAARDCGAVGDDTPDAALLELDPREIERRVSDTSRDFVYLKRQLPPEQAARVVKLGGFVQAGPDFYDVPKVINGCSDLFVEVFGDRGAGGVIKPGETLIFVVDLLGV